MKTLVILLIALGIATTSFAQADTTQLVIKVKGITCANDLNIIHGKLKEVDGLMLSENYGPVGPTSEIRVMFDPQATDPEAIYRAIEDSPACDFPDQRPYKVKR